MRGEVLYRPLDSNWAFGPDANYVMKSHRAAQKKTTKFTDYSV
ncbi:YjbH domain-containing protein [Escherichia coli]